MSRFERRLADLESRTNYDSDEPVRDDAKALLRDVLEEARFRLPGGENARSAAGDLINALLEAVDRVR